MVKLLGSVVKVKVKWSKSGCFEQAVEKITNSKLESNSN